MSNIQAINDHDFDSEVIASQAAVLVDFWAPWCGPCKVIAPLLEDITQTFPELKIVKLDVDQNPATPPKFGVRGIPTLILFKDGQVKATHVGLLSKAELVSFIEAHI